MLVIIARDLYGMLGVMTGFMWHAGNRNNRFMWHTVGFLRSGHSRNVQLYYHCCKDDDDYHCISLASLSGSG